MSQSPLPLGEAAVLAGLQVRGVEVVEPGHIGLRHPVAAEGLGRRGETMRCAARSQARLEEDVQSLGTRGVSRTSDRGCGDGRENHRALVASQVLYEVCAPGLIVVSRHEEPLVHFLDTFSSPEGALAATHAVEELLWALVHRLVKQSLAVATHAFEVEQLTQLWVLDLETGDPHAEGDFVGAVLRVDAVPGADPDVGLGVARLVFHDLVDAEEATFQDGLNGLVSRLSGVVGLGVEEGLGPGPVGREELTEVFVFGARVRRQRGSTPGCSFSCLQAWSAA